MTETSKLVKLASLDSEVEAAAMLGLLQDHGIQATVDGGLIVGFRAEAPGEVNVWVHEGDAQRAAEILREHVPARRGRTESETDRVDLPADGLWRAWYAAIIGTVLLPPLLNVYSLWLLWRHGLSGEDIDIPTWLIPATVLVDVTSLLFFGVLYFGLFFL